jgi:hypothetical protein
VNRYDRLPDGYAASIAQGKHGMDLPAAEILRHAAQRGKELNLNGAPPLYDPFASRDGDPTVNAPALVLQSVRRGHTWHLEALVGVHPTRLFAASLLLDQVTPFVPHAIGRARTQLNAPLPPMYELHVTDALKVPRDLRDQYPITVRLVDHHQSGLVYNATTQRFDVANIPRLLVPDPNDNYRSERAKQTPGGVVNSYGASTSVTHKMVLNGPGCGRGYVLDLRLQLVVCYEPDR